MTRYKRSPHEFGLPPRAAGGGKDYIAGIPRNLLNDFNMEVTQEVTQEVTPEVTPVVPHLPTSATVQKQ